MVNDLKHVFNNTEIYQSKVNEEVKQILDILRKEKQTYAVNKFVLEESIKALDETIID